MKTVIFFILVIAFSLKAPNAQAQTTVPNNGFENLNSDGTLQNWGNVYITSAWLDSSGIFHGDSIVYDNSYYAPTNDAQSGSRALELRNAWNYTLNIGIAGAVGSDEDSIFSSWGLQNLVPTSAITPYPFAPSDFSFYYQYFPVNGDSAYVQITLWDSVGYQIGEGQMIISGLTSNYTLAHVPISYTAPGDAAAYSFIISNFYTETPGFRQPSFGTRFLVDDIEFDFTTAVVQPQNNDNQFTIYPNPVSTELNIYNQGNKDCNYVVYNLLGQMMKEGNLSPNSNTISVDHLDAGVYSIEINKGKTSEAHRFVVRK